MLLQMLQLHNMKQVNYYNANWGISLLHKLVNVLILHLLMTGLTNSTPATGKFAKFFNFPCFNFQKQLQLCYYSRCHLWNNLK